MATKTLYYCEIQHVSGSTTTTYDVIIGVDTTDDVDTILQAWALTVDGPGEALNLPEELTEMKLAKDVNLILKTLNEFAYV